ncbi:cytochrome P450 4V2-like [Schistocerca gregaria]|uniref:cytochrome P450 4V2-like n=1 Tax=Schistocerca gregaria TaxID=7010 RepID=UPI00211EB9D9|nr:cytochrome P450 4V2-like [Schistocerca gregaria]
MAVVWWLLQLLAALVVGLWWAWLRRPRCDAPGDPPVPLLGNLMQLGNPRTSFCTLCRMHAVHGSTFCIYVGPILYVIVAEPRDAELLLGSTKIVDRTRDSPYLHNMVSIFFGDGLFSKRGDQWRAHRKIISPTFHLQILEQFLEVFNAGAEVLTKRLAATCGQEVDLFPVVSLTTLEMIVETAMGSTSADEGAVGGPTNRDFVAALSEAIRLMQELSVRPWLRVKWLTRLTRTGRETRRVVATLRQYGDRLVALKTRQLHSGVAADQSQPTPDKKRRLAFLDTVLSSCGGLLTSEEVCDEVYTLISAGNETTANTISFTLALLALHPGWQQAVHAELDAVFGEGCEGENCHRPATPEDLAKLQVLDRVIKETLRMFPVAPLLPRHVPHDLVLPSSGYRLSRDSMAVVFSYFMHRNATYFPEPDRFDPDRFLPENCVGRHPYCYVPFGAGLRNCVGKRYAVMQVKTLLAAVLRKFFVLPVSTMEDLHDLALSIVIHPISGMRVVLQGRHHHDHNPSPPSERATGII